MKANVRKFRLALTVLTLVALSVGIAAFAVSPVRADEPGGYDERIQTGPEPPKARPPRSPQGSTPADVDGQAEHRADLQDLPVPKLAPVPVSDWVITANFDDMTIHTVDTATDTVYGPFLGGQLGTPGGVVLDVAITPDGTIALVSSFLDRVLYFVGICDPTNPSLLGSVDLSGIPMYAEDIAITPDGKFALITDGGGATVVASVNIATRTVVDAEDIAPNAALAVAVAPNGTVIVADYWGGFLHTLTIDGSGNLSPVVASYSDTTVEATAEWEGVPWPFNVDVAPDGQTVIVCYGWDFAVGVYQVTGPGTLTFSGNVEGLPGTQQSVAFSAAGDQAYVVSAEDYPDDDPTTPDQLSVLDITAPGNVSLNTAGAANLLSDSGGGWYGVDVIAVANGVAYVGNPSSIGTVNDLAVVNLTTYSVSPLAVGDFPVGVAARSLGPPVTLTVEVQTVGGGPGTVISDPVGINCGADCTETYARCSGITLEALPGVKSYIASWSGDCSGTGTTAQVTMDDDKHCIAIFGYPVGGIAVPVDKVGLLMPGVGLAGLAALGVVVVRRRRGG